MLCTGYKIITKILANCLKCILPEIISEEQNCSVTDRAIFNYLLLVKDITRYTKEKNIIYYKLTKRKPLARLVDPFYLKQWKN